VRFLIGNCFDYHSLQITLIFTGMARNILKKACFLIGAL
jgi:hypothetical protein